MAFSHFVTNWFILVRYPGDTSLQNVSLFLACLEIQNQEKSSYLFYAKGPQQKQQSDSLLEVHSNHNLNYVPMKLHLVDKLNLHKDLRPRLLKETVKFSTYTKVYLQSFNDTAIVPRHNGYGLSFLLPHCLPDLGMLLYHLGFPKHGVHLEVKVTRNGYPTILC